MGQILSLLATGAGYTVLVTLACSATGIAVGLAIAVLGRLGWRTVDAALAVFTYVFRGIPVLVLLFIVFFGLPGIGVGVPPLVSMMLSLGLIAGAYLGEVFRGALDSVDAGEILAAEAMGMSRLQVFAYIELPQMLRFSVPGMINEFTTILKYSPFGYTVGIPEVMKQAMALSATTLRGVEIYCAVGLLYFAIYKVLVTGIWALEKRYRVPGLTGH
ncbi:Inner membrane amino-acid ABC transporter permease protein YecS [Pigmentiphaga humi]|uniref:Inner membrane amino-acid ABC transporter permease protein YecS n=1 Tax=Pigmentiphaga humi TaxID=2478468 RepID=A0A3P4AZG8_9BURK|nr:amino acid ABC transporter permease [Pigmentiphaga humi]VCU68880.1 Inner membrane amino-acid ABC transporter permease protein YecS [Pigmentiphaga humi]